jgi:hypothetical protein
VSHKKENITILDIQISRIYIYITDKVGRRETKKRGRNILPHRK